MIHPNSREIIFLGETLLKAIEVSDGIVEGRGG
jgi:hypothetical protein